MQTYDVTIRRSVNNRLLQNDDRFKKKFHNPSNYTTLKQLRVKATTSHCESGAQTITQPRHTINQAWTITHILPLMQSSKEAYVVAFWC